VDVKSKGNWFGTTIKVTLHLHEILFIPNFTKNLISLSHNLFLTIKFSFIACIFKDLHTKTPIFQVPSFNSLFIISLDLSTSPQAYVNLRVSVDLWHARLSNPSSTTTTSIIKSFSLACNSQKLSMYYKYSIVKSHRLLFTASTSTSLVLLDLFQQWFLTLYYLCG
jgi:hypothetical protein